MSADSNIEWTHHTWNPVSGCHKVSEECTNCYAANLPPAMRRHAVWGPNTPRMPASESYLLAPLAWNAAAAKAGERHRVFCGSVMDIGEDRPDMDPVRDRALATVYLTPNLDHLWLTKRPERLVSYFADPALYDRVLRAADAIRTRPAADGINRARRGVPVLGISNPAHGLPRNLWVGTSIGKASSLWRARALAQISARVRFWSCEPLLGDLGDVSSLLHSGAAQWVIAGGESGRRARPMHPDWARSLRDRCRGAGVPFFFKQWGEFTEVNPEARDPETGDHVTILEDEADGRFTPGLSVGVALDGHVARSLGAMRPDIRYRHMHHVGKAAAGRLLDGRTWDEFPAEAR